MRVLVVNAGSSSLKYQLIDPPGDRPVAAGAVQRIGEDAAGPRDHRAAFRRMLDDLSGGEAGLRGRGPDAVGHRVVHGGAFFTAPTLIDDDVLDALVTLESLAPLHNPANVEGIRTARELLPQVPQIAVFDTAFHATLPEPARTYAVPRRWRERYGVRRYGFHGTSHAHVSRRVHQLLGAPDRCGIVTLHLGNGASACAVLDGRSVATSMGLSPLEGLVMGTRSGDVDPALTGHLHRVAGLGVEQVEDALNHASGLLALAGDNDFREVTRRAQAGDGDARLAIEVSVHRIVSYVGGYAALMGRLDALAFTGGIGENAAGLREQVLQRLALFGVELDDAANRSDPAPGAERRVTTSGSRVAGFVMPPGEEQEIARQCRELLQAAAS